MKTITVQDRSTYEISKREILDNGYMIVPGRVARTGVQKYLARELSITDRSPDDIIRVMRPDSEVFSNESLQTYKDSDVTIEHPTDMVNSDSFRQTSVGHVMTDGIKDGDFVTCDLLIKDKDAINAINNGKVQLSAGYTAVYNDASDDEDYDLIQTDIKINHVALVDRGRAGAQVRLFDNEKEGQTMPVTIVLDPSTKKSVEVEDKAVATLIDDTVKQLYAQTEKQQATIDGLQEKLSAATHKTSEDIIEKRIAAISTTQSTASKIAGKSFLCDSLDVPTIQREALAVLRPKVDWKNKSDIYVQAAFDQAEEMSEDEEEEDEKVKDSYKKLSQDMATPTQPKESAYDKFKSGFNNAWKEKV